MTPAWLGVLIAVCAAFGFGVMLGGLMMFSMKTDEGCRAGASPVVGAPLAAPQGGASLAPASGWNDSSGTVPRLRIVHQRSDHEQPR